MTGLNNKRIFYINLEDDRLPELDKRKSFASLIDGSYELYPKIISIADRWLFVDEVQNAPDRPSSRRLLDTNTFLSLSQDHSAQAFE